MKSTLLNIPSQEKGILPVSAGWDIPSFSQEELLAKPTATSLIPQESTGHDTGKTTLTPILSPLVVSGVESEALKRMQPLFHTYGWYPVQGGSYVLPADHPEKSRLVPGASVAAILIRGDLSAAVVGTVTYVEGDNVLAFGHPFLQTGKADLSMASAYVYTVLCSQSNSVK